MDGMYYKPRIDLELMQQHSKGLIATSGCASGEVQTRLRLGQYEAAKQAAAKMQDVFGKENYFIEVMDHGIEIERRSTKDLLRLAKELDIPLLASNDLHYTHHEDADAHAALLCVQSGSTLADPKRFKFDNSEFYVKTAAQMRELFKDMPGACDNTLLIAERCNVTLREGENLMPRFDVPQGETEDSWLRSESIRSLAEKLGDASPSRLIFE
jgi:DNA polymerase-3 subunit alpha